MAKNTVLDAKRDYPVTSNAIVCSVKFLVDAGWYDMICLMDDGGVHELLIELQTTGLSINGGPTTSFVLNLTPTPSFHHEYG
uniref:Uncharacterized protein n=1 Tax=Lactuca sativa TaxID=4236 RepID=A0A9R1V751_LACSA|nr:hypothetical protein LSAT_V11C600320270 [Lactuca sativa]